MRQAEIDLKQKLYQTTQQPFTDFNPEYYVHSFSTNVSIDNADNNKKGDQICVGGTQQLKILACKESALGEIQIEQVRSLSAGNVNVNHVSWSTTNENQIVTSYQVGNKFSVWDVSKGSVVNNFQKEHTQMTHKVYWHPSDPNQLISTSRDRTVKIWDLRQQNSTTTISLRDSAQDVKFCPHNPQYILTAEESGQIEQTVYCIDFNPGQPKVFASGSLDKKVGVWRIDEKQSIVELTKYNHIVGVGQVKWSVADPRELIISGFSINHEIHVVNLSNPFRPYKIYNGHTEQVTAILFKDAKYIMTCAKGSKGTILTRLLSNGYKPYVQIPRNLVSIDLNNNIAFRLAKEDNEITVSQNEFSKHKLKKFFEDLTLKNDRQDPYSVGIYDQIGVNEDFGDPKDELIFFAKNYKIEAQLSLREKAEYNAKIAKFKNKIYTSKLWLEFADIFCPKDNTNQSVQQSQPSLNNTGIPSTGNTLLQQQQQQNNKPISKLDSIDIKKDTPPNIMNSSTISSTQPQSQNQSSQQQSQAQQQQQQSQSLQQSKGVTQQSDKNTSNPNSLTNGQEQIKEEVDAEMIFKYFENNPSALTQALNNEDLIHQNDNTLFISQYLKEQILSSFSQQKKSQQKIKLEDGQIHPTVMKSCIDSLQELIDLGELLSAHVISLVFKDFLIIDNNLKTLWKVDLVELLRSYRLYNYANYFDQFSSNNPMDSMKKTFLIKCNCGKGLDGPKCENCQKIVKCSYCKLAVKGLLLWCQVCTHGGHVKELSNWFKTNNECPTGCGHNCFSSLRLQ